MDIERYQTEDGHQLVATAAGPVDAPRVILMHGGGQTRHSWHGAVGRLSRLGYRAISFDARGHGDSDWSTHGDYGFETRARDLAAIINAHTTPTALVGASMGGMTALHALGGEAPPEARALVLVDIVPRPARDGVLKITQFMRAHAGGFATVEDAADAVAAYNPHRPRPSDPSGLMKNLRRREDGRLYWHWDPKILHGDDEARFEQQNNELAAACRRVRAPTLLVHGADSDVVDEAGVAELRDLLPDVEVLEVPGAGHMVAGDKNDAFNDGIVRFLDARLKV